MMNGDILKSNRKEKRRGKTSAKDSNECPLGDGHISTLLEVATKWLYEAAERMNP